MAGRALLNCQDGDKVKLQTQFTPLTRYGSWCLTSLYGDFCAIHLHHQYSNATTLLHYYPGCSYDAHYCLQLFANGEQTSFM